MISLPSFDLFKRKSGRTEAHSFGDEVRALEGSVAAGTRCTRHLPYGTCADRPHQPHRQPGRTSRWRRQPHHFDAFRDAQRVFVSQLQHLKNQRAACAKVNAPPSLRFSTAGRHPLPFNSHQSLSSQARARHLHAAIRDAYSRPKL